MQTCLPNRLLALSFLAGLLAALSGSACSRGDDPAIRQVKPPAHTPERSRIGMNLTGVYDWTREWPLVDVFKYSRPWMKSGPGEFTYDEHGNPLLKPGQTVETLLLREIHGHYPRGKYVATWEGSGRVEIRRFDVKRVLLERPGRIEFEVEPGHGGIQVVVSASDPRDPIRNFHVWMPGFEQAQSPFHPLFVERLQPFGVLRFMDWQRTNYSPIKTWAQRAKLTDARWTNDAGMPLELMIDLANTCKADPWFCMPHQADDEYVRQFARLVKGRLDPALKVYIEYSNEVWNGQFPQSRYAQEQGLKLKLSENPFQAQLRWYSQRSVEVFKLWEEVFGQRDRLVRVLASQAVNPWASEQILTWRDAHQQADALAIAPYFGHSYGNPKTVEDVLKMTPEKLLDALAAEVEGDNRNTIAKQAQLARKFKLELVAYEGGQHLAGHGGAENNQALTDLFIAVNRHPRMGDLYTKHLRNWFEEGGGLYLIFSNVSAPSKWGSWGVLEYQDQPLEKAPKLRAILNLLRTG